MEDTLDQRVSTQEGAPHRATAAAAEFTFMASLFGLYYATRGLAAGRAYEAFTHAMQLMQLEQRLGIFYERGIQNWVLTMAPLVRFLNFVYAYTHLTAVILFGLWVYWYRSRYYRTVRAVFLTVLFSGLLCYILIPMAPPRFFSWRGFVDTLALYQGINYDNQRVEVFYNPFAAMPSLHAAFALFCGLGIIRISRHWARWILGLGFPLLMALAVIGTGNHYVFDVLAGFTLASVAWVVVPRFVPPGELPDFPWELFLTPFTQRTAPVRADSVPVVQRRR